MSKKTKLINVALAEVGYLEKASNKNLNSKTANAGDKNYTKYGKWINLNGQYWCASFVSWCFYTTFGYNSGKSILGCYSGACETIRKNITSVTTPKAGDIIFFTGTRHSGANHIGIIYKVTSTRVYTVEGNTSGGSTVVDNGGGVAKKSYSKAYSRILGYGRPKYSSAAVETIKRTYTGTFPSTFPSRGYYQKGDGITTCKGFKSEIKRIQAFLNWALTAGLDVDGQYGAKTVSAVKKFQKNRGITKDGLFGKTTLAAAKIYSK